MNKKAGRVVPKGRIETKTARLLGGLFPFNELDSI